MGGFCRIKWVVYFYWRKILSILADEQYFLCNKLYENSVMGMIAVDVLRQEIKQNYNNFDILVYL